MTVRTAGLLLSFFMASSCLCGPSVDVDAGPGDVDAGTPDAGTPDAGAPDAGAPDAGAPDAGATPTACEVKVVATSPACNADCEARLFLPDGRRYCTLTCATLADCAPYGDTLTCASETGTCMPRCLADADCVAQGFPRCHPVGSFCDTLPACRSDQLCLDNGLTTCVLAGNYCQ